MVGPGLSLLPLSFLGAFYALILAYMFLGVAIVSDIFMEAIEEITSQTKCISFTDNMGQQREVEVLVWNATVANLTLMALGSSAPEIMLSCIETITQLDSEVKGELGPSTIVGSAAFNLLIISAVSIVSVDKPKKIDDLGVFTVTACMSIFAYVWLVIVLKIWGPEGEVTILESCLTLMFCLLLIIAAYAADLYRRKQKKAD